MSTFYRRQLNYKSREWRITRLLETLFALWGWKK